MPSLASIIIVNWNGRHWLETCLPAVLAQTYPSFEVILVDNGSTDGSPLWLKTTYPTVHLISLAENTGFAHPNNVGLAAAQGEYIVTLNNDTKPTPNWLAELVAGQNGPDVGMVASKILLWQSPHLLDSAGIYVNAGGVAWNRGWGQPATTADKAGYVFGPSAAAALYYRPMLAEIGFFDEDFFAYYEDVDLAWRGQRAGWRCWYTPTAEVLHHHSATSAGMGPRKMYLLARNKLWTLAKNYSGRQIWWGWSLILAYEIGSILYQLGHSRSLIPFQARRDALRQFTYMLRKRQPAKN